MKKRKGFTIVELMVSIAIIAVVMVFLVRMLIDIRYDRVNELYDTANQINRAEIIKTIENDFLNQPLVDINTTGSNPNELVINLKRNDDKTGIIRIKAVENNDYVYYTKCDGTKKKWKLEKNNSETYIQKTKIPFKFIKGDATNDYTVIINIPVIVDHSKLRTTNDSQMDNIILTFSGNVNTSFENKEFLN